jgi:hypothetical protein
VAEALSQLAEIRVAEGLSRDAEILLLQAMEITADRLESALLPRKIHGQLADLYETMGRREAAARHRALASAGSPGSTSGTSPLPLPQTPQT